MSISAEQIQVFYEISMSIGASLDMSKMLKAFLPTLLKRLNCSCGGVIRFDGKAGSPGNLKEVYAIPRKPENNAAYRMALDLLRDQIRGGSAARLRGRLPLSEGCPGRSFYHILDLPGFGFLILIKNCRDLDPLIIKSLAPLLSKLASACLACLKDEDLRQSEDRFRDLFENANDLIQSVDPRGRFQFVNKKWLQTLGYTKGELADLSLKDILRPDQIPHCMDAFQRVIEGQTFERIEAVFIAKDGREVFVEGNVNALRRNGSFVATRGIFRDVTERKHAEAQIKASLKQKEVLLQEIHHRVKNNMQIMMSLLRLQTSGVDNPVMQEEIKEYNNRILTMSLIHQKLYQTKNFSEVNFGEYILTLVNQLFKVYSVPPGKIRVVPDLQDVILDVKKAIPCGLLVNELVSNVLKYAFPDDQKGEMRIELCQRDDGKTCLLVEDTGVGLPHDFDIKTSASLGMQLIDDLTKELDGSLEQDHSRGCCFKISF